MKVRELIENLEMKDPELEVVVYIPGDEGFFEPVADLRVVQTRTLNHVEILYW